MSSLKRLQTLPLPPAQLSGGRTLALGNSMPFEPRLMPDGSVLLSTYGCGFYRVTGMDATAEVHNVYTLDVPTKVVLVDTEAACGIPIIVDHYWIMAVGQMGMLLTLRAVKWDESFRSPNGQLGISFVHDNWPHGKTGAAFGHAALFRQ